MLLSYIILVLSLDRFQGSNRGVVLQSTVYSHESLPALNLLRCFLVVLWLALHYTQGLGYKHVAY